MSEQTELKIRMDGPFSAKGLKALSKLEQTATGVCWTITGTLASAVAAIVEREAATKTPIYPVSAEVKRMRIVMACLLDAYLDDDDGDDALSIEVKAMVPDWKDLIGLWTPHPPN